MGYDLQAVIAAEPLLRHVVRDIPQARIVPIRQQFALLPMTDELFDAVNAGTEQRLGGFWKFPAGFEQRLAEWSSAGPVAYVEADYFGGVGSQNAAVWEGGSVVLGPLRLEEHVAIAKDGTAISQALRRLGVDKGPHYDEFVAVGLDRHRHMEDWAG